MYRAAHDHRGWYVVNAEGREITEPHPDRDYTIDRAEALNVGRERRLSRQQQNEDGG